MLIAKSPKKRTSTESHNGRDRFETSFETTNRNLTHEGETISWEESFVPCTVANSVQAFSWNFKLAHKVVELSWIVEKEVFVWLWCFAVYTSNELYCSGPTTYKKEGRREIPETCLCEIKLAVLFHLLNVINSVYRAVPANQAICKFLPT